MAHRGYRTAAVVLLAGVTGAVVVGAPSAAPGPKPPKTVNGHKLRGRHGELKRGTLVASSVLGTRVFTNDSDGFALATPSSGETYPAVTLDGGKTWRVNGPVFHIPAADAPEAVSGVGIAGRKTYFAFGGSDGGNAVDVTTDAGKVWYQAFLGGSTASVISSFRHKLIAFAPTGSSAGTWTDVSTDGGRVWHFRNNIP